MIEQKIRTANQNNTVEFPLKVRTDPRIVFMGTPEFAVATLDKLVESGCNIVGVITAPDKEAGRGMELRQTAVKKYAIAKGLHLLQPAKLKVPAFIAELKALAADLQVVVAFRMLPEIVWNMPPMGTVNLHGSLLPQYRGAAPINWAIINGEKETGVTTFRLQQQVDTGNILLSETIPIGDEETAGELHDKMKLIGADLMLKTVRGLAAGTLEEIPQSIVLPGGDTLGGDSLLLKQAPKIFTETCRIDWNKPARQVFNLVRGLSPHPAAFSYLEGKILKIYKADIKYDTNPTPPGTWRTDRKSFLQFACADGYLVARELQLEGKKRMNVIDFLKGYRFAE